MDLRDVAESAPCVHGRDFMVGASPADAVSLELWLKSARDRAESERRVLFHRASRRRADPGCARVYFHGGGEKAEAPSVDSRGAWWTRRGERVLEENLKVFYVVHPTAWLQAGMLWGSLTGALSSGVF